MTVPGVGPIVALSFIATVDDVGRFARATDVGAYLGLTPRRYQSGEIDYSGRISKRGDSAMRALLPPLHGQAQERTRRPRTSTPSGRRHPMTVGYVLNGALGTDVRVHDGGSW